MIELSWGGGQRPAEFINVIKRKALYSDSFECDIPKTVYEYLLIHKINARMEILNKKEWSYTIRFSTYSKKGTTIKNWCNVCKKTTKHIEIKGYTEITSSYMYYVCSNCGNEISEKKVL